MTGYPDFNYPAFNAEAALLRLSSSVVYNPAEYPHDGPLEEFPIREAFDEYCNFICRIATHMVMLKGWEKSVGARAEHALALAVGVEIIYS